MNSYIDENIETLEPNRNYHPSTSLNPDLYHIFTFPYFEHFQLVAIVGKKTGERQIRIEYVGLNNKILDGNEISDCYILSHNSDTRYIIEKWLKSFEIGTNKKVNFVPDENYSREILTINEKIRSGVDPSKIPSLFESNHKRVIELIQLVEEISKSGIQFLFNLRSLLNFPPPYDISDTLLSFIAHHDYSIVHQYLEFFQGICYKDGQYSTPLLIKALYGFRGFIFYSIKLDIKYIDQIDQYTYQKRKQYNNAQSLIADLISMKLPLRVYMEIFPYQILKTYFSDHRDFEREIFRKKHVERWVEIAADPKGIKYKRFHLLYTCKYPSVLETLVMSPLSHRKSDFVKLFDSEEPRVLIALARSLYAAKLPQYRKLFDIKKYGIQGYIAGNPEACKFSEFGRFLRIKNIKGRKKFTELLAAALGNPNVKNVPNYKKFVERYSDDRWYGWYIDHSY